MNNNLLYCFKIIYELFDKHINEGSLIIFGD